MAKLLSSLYFHQIFWCNTTGWLVNRSWPVKLWWLPRCHSIQPCSSTACGGRTEIKRKRPSWKHWKRQDCLSRPTRDSSSLPYLRTNANGSRSFFRSLPTKEMESVVQLSFLWCLTNHNFFHRLRTAKRDKEQLVSAVVYPRAPP